MLRLMSNFSAWSASRKRGNLTKGENAAEQCSSLGINSQLVRVVTE
jgi:hypothetical protein